MNEPILECDLCDFVAPQKEAVLSHKAEMHQEVSCDQCDYKAASAINLEKHQKIYHDGTTYFCDECNFEANSRFQIKTHKISEHAIYDQELDGEI